MSEDTPEDQMTEEMYCRDMIEAMGEQCSPYTYSTTGSATLNVTFDKMLESLEQFKPLAEAYRKSELLVAEEWAKLQEQQGFEEWFTSLPVMPHDITPRSNSLPNSCYKGTQPMGASPYTHIENCSVLRDTEKAIEVEYGGRSDVVPPFTYC